MIWWKILIDQIQHWNLVSSTLSHFYNVNAFHSIDAKG